MKKLILIIITCFIGLPLTYAGSIRFESPQKINDNQYLVYLKAKDMDTNYISGQISITNGTLTDINMSNGWVNKTGTNNNFYFYHNGIINGEYIIATFKVTMTGNSTYTINNLNYGKNECTKDRYGNYYEKSGKIVSENIYQNECLKNSDATLKILMPSTGTLSPNFDSNIDTYNLSVKNNQNQITFQAIPNSSKSKILSGTTCNLNAAETNCYIVVASELGTQKTYTVKVHKENTIKKNVDNFIVHNGSLTEAFKESKTTYNLVPNKNAELISFSFTVNGTQMNSQSCSAKASTCTLSITFENQKRIYTFHILTENMTSSNSVAVVNESSQKTETSKTATSKTTAKTTTKKKADSSTSNSTSISSSQKESATKTPEVVEQVEEKSENKETDETIDPIVYNKNKQDEETQEKKENENQNEEPESQNNINTKWLKIASGIFAIVAGIGIGLFIRKR